jgi:hypothetical protein
MLPSSSGKFLHVDPVMSKEKGMEVFRCYAAKLIRLVPPRGSNNEHF